MNRNRIIFILSIMGIVIAAYVTQSFVRQASIVCVNTGCEVVRKHPASYIAGIPVPAFGLAGYTLLALLAFARTLKLSIRNSQFVIRALLTIAAGGVAFVLWFTYIELTVIKAICTWCAISGINMVAILTLTVISYKKENKL